MNYNVEKKSFEIIETYKINFNDGKTNIIDFGPTVKQKGLESLKGKEYFDRITFDHNHNLVWPNGKEINLEALYY
ncbi:MAG: hypothetical protein ChlgKO_02790 [Chlamydiales bacterium]